MCFLDSPAAIDLLDITIVYNKLNIVVFLKSLKRFSRLIHASQLLDGADEISSDLLVILKKLMNFQNVTDDMVKKLDQGSLTISPNGDIVNNSQGDMNDRQNAGINEAGIIMEKPCVKIGKYFTLRPTDATSRDYKQLCKLVNLGIKKMVDVKDAGVKYKDPVKSLNFWDEENYRQNLLEFENIKESFAVDLENSGISLRMREKLDERFESAKYFELGDNINLLNGILIYLGNVDSFYENLTFVSNWGSKGHRIVHSNNPNIIGITFPSDSILKTNVKKPYVIVCLQKKTKTDTSTETDYNDEIKARNYFNSVGQTFFSFETEDYYVRLSNGKSESSKTLSARVHTTEKFMSLFGCAYSLFKKHSRNIPNRVGWRDLMMNCLFLSVNVNINNSSLLDNLRYLVDNSLADYSAAGAFIEEKLVIPCKNLFQIKLFGMTKNLLLRANRDSESIRVTRMEVDDDNAVIPETARIEDAVIHSFLSETIIYNCPDALLQEVIACFFCTNKGLHDPVHNSKDIHKTPVEIQMKLDKLKEEKYGDKDGLHFMGDITKDLDRHQFDPDIVIASTLSAHRDTNASITIDRRNILQRSLINKSPFLIKTMTSTRTTAKLVEREKEKKICEDAYEMVKQRLGSLTNDDQNVLLQVTDLMKTISYTRSKKRRSYLNKRKLKPLVDMFSREVRGLFLNEIKFNNSIGGFYIEGNIKNEQEVLKLCDNDTKKVVSVPVLTETLNEYINDFENMTYDIGTLGDKSKEVLLRKDSQIYVAIRPKMQRTQKDREIYVLNLEGKFLLYPIEHTYKSISIEHPYEKISVPGDEKIIDMKRQVDDQMRWIRCQKDSESNKGKELIVQHYNLDFTKWSPKDNTLKYIYVIAYNYLLTPSEKMFMIASLCKHYYKKVFLDHDLLTSAYKSTKQLSESGVEYECIFEKATVGFTTAFVGIKENWLQGQLNYISSFLHSGCMGLWNRCIESLCREKGDSFKTYSNTHSDDNQTTLVLYTLDTDEDTMVRSMNLIKLITAGCTFEPSLKKNFISKFQKEFISQMNIAGQQKSFWVKPVMSMVSGVPYTTVKDDYSSVYSKVSEAITKGAPVESVQGCLKVILDGVDRVYGLSGYKPNNVVSSVLGIRQEFLPVALGGRVYDKLSTVAVLGPRYLDKIILMKNLEVLKIDLETVTGSTDEILQSDAKEFKESKEALKLFWIMDVLSRNIVQEEMDLSACESFNPFKSIKYTVRKKNLKDPFSYKTMQERNDMKETFLNERQTSLIIKPQSFEDVVNYYNVLYMDPTFKASLSGQSPESLMLHKICNKKTQGNFAFSSSETFDRVVEKLDAKYLQEEDIKTMTALDLSFLLQSLMSKIVLDKAMVRDLWVRYISIDKEFKECYYTEMNMVAMCSVRAENLIPLQSTRKKMSFNHLNELLHIKGP